MGKLFKQIHRPRATHQAVINNLVIASHCWAGINDLAVSATGIDSRNIKRARRQSDSNLKNNN